MADVNLAAAGMLFGTLSPTAASVNLRPAGGGSDTNPPTVTLIAAPKLPDDTAVIRVTDDVGLRRVVLFVRWPSGWEVIHDGDGFGPNYQGGANTRNTVIAGRQYDYFVKRQPSWPSGILPLDVLAIDTSGNEA